MLSVATSNFLHYLHGERSLETEAAVEMHMTGDKHECKQCHKSFKKQRSLVQHINDAGHFYGTDSDTDEEDGDGDHRDELSSSTSSSDFVNIRHSQGRHNGRDQHGNNSAAGADELDLRLQELDLAPPELDSPLDRFFTSFPVLKYDPVIQPSVTFAQLRNHLGKTYGFEDMQLLRKRFHVAIDAELEEWYGQKNELSAWQRLCEVTIGPRETQSITACKKVSLFLYLIGA